jgi:hypothetical protein
MQGVLQIFELGGLDREKIPDAGREACLHREGGGYRS